jgi:phosphatidylinositol glycan class B
MRRLTSAQLILVGGLVVGAALRLWVAFTDDGIFWPDEVFQSIEPAHRLVFGYGMVAWEFIEGARNWALPGFIAFWFKLSQIFGGDAPEQYLGVIRTVFVAIAVGAGYGVWRLAKAAGADELPAAVAAMSLMLCAPAIYFSHRGMAENASALPVVLGLWLVLEQEPTRRKRILGASLLGIAVLLRLQCGLFCLGALTILLARKQWRPALEVLGVLGVWAVLYGALDALTWADAPGAKYGGWFHSALLYLRFNLIEGKASQWGTSPPAFYVKALFTSMPGVTIALAIGLLLALRRAPGLVIVALVFICAHSAIPHKELRFILPVLPVLFAAAAVGYSQLPKLPQRALLALVAVASVVSAVRMKALTFGDLGAYPERKTVSAWDDYGPVFRLMLAASKRDDVCGLLIEAHLAWTGGSAYLHRNAPLYMPGMAQVGTFNYAIVGIGRVPGAPVVATDGAMELIQMPNPQCAPDPGYRWVLP